MQHTTEKYIINIINAPYSLLFIHYHFNHERRKVSIAHRQTKWNSSLKGKVDYIAAYTNREKWLNRNYEKFTYYPTQLLSGTQMFLWLFIYLGASTSSSQLNVYTAVECPKVQSLFFRRPRCADPMVQNLRCESSIPMTDDLLLVFP